MPDAPAVDALLDRVYRHFPRGLDCRHPRYRDSEPARRRAGALEAAALACGKGVVRMAGAEPVIAYPDVLAVIDALRAWRRFGDRLRGAFPDRQVWDDSGPFFDPGYRYSVGQAGYVQAQGSGAGAGPGPGPGMLDDADAAKDDPYDPVVCMVSVLAPVFAMFTLVPVPGDVPAPRYADFPARYRDRIDAMSALAEDVFGFARLDADTLRTPVPDLHLPDGHRAMGEATLADCLFTVL